MTSLAHNAIALLIDLAERGELDPWNVQVIEVIDRFLSQLQPVAAADGRAPYEADLSRSGQAFLYASVLVLLKADSLAREAEAVETPPEQEVELLEPDSTLPLRLERQLRRRAVARPPQSRRVTLSELIAQLEMMSTALAEPPRARARRPQPHSRSQAIKAIAQLAHQENLSEVAAAIEKFLQDHWDHISGGEDWMDFERLLEQWAQSDVNPLPSHSPQGDRVAVFWALLFLSAQSKVELAQTEFYQDLQVRSLDSPSDSLTAAAADLSLALLD